MVGVHLVGHKVGSHRIGVDMVVYLRQLSFGTPTDGLLLFGLQSLEFLYDEDFELMANPHGKLEGNVLMGIGTTVTAGFGLQADSIGTGNKLLDTYLESVQPRLTIIVANSP